MTLRRSALESAHSARDIIDRLRLGPHPEGGWYRETWRAAASEGQLRGAGTAILFLLGAGERSHWHRVDASELWIFQAGSALTLSVVDPVEGTNEAVSGRTHAVSAVRLGPDVMNGDELQFVVAPHQWQSAVAGDDWCLVACVVVPAFEFSGFEMAPAGWSPGC